ncbi:MAG: universal stress protein [Candidatus Brachytrichaceae bacterium NZ_4S206]|jgi:nucleotide-binding universal stress UspA family protein
MYRKILVPLDGSALSAAVLPRVRPIARCAGAHVVLLRVIPEIGMRVGAPLPPADAQFAEQPDAPLETVPREIAHYESAARAYLNQVAAEFATAGIATHTRVVTGPITEGILDVASEEGVDLIAMSTHGRGGLGRFLLGSIAGQIVHYAKMPVLLVRATADEQPPAECSYRKLLVPLDGSDFSHTVLPHACEVAACVGAQVILLQAIPEPEPETSEAHWMLTFGGPASIGEVPGEGGLRPGMDLSAQRRWAESIRAELVRRAEHEMEAAQSNLDAAASVFKLANVPVETMIQVGRPAEVILDAATANEVDMIAMATHGRSGIQRLLLGSVADRIVRHARVPVLLVRPESTSG